MRPDTGPHERRQKVIIVLTLVAVPLFFILLAFLYQAGRFSEMFR